MKAKKQGKSPSAFGRLMAYAGRYKKLTYMSLILSALSSVLALLPFVCLWRIILEVLEVRPDFSRATGIVRNGWLAVLFAVLAWLVYVGALVCSHGSAFRTAANMKKALMRHIARLPIGFADEMLNLLTVPVERMNEIADCPAQTGTTDFRPAGYDIRFENVGFSYDDDKAVLKDVTFTAKQGQVTALVGPSGGGKTTVSRLAARFWDVSKGRITVGGQDISQIDPETLLGVYAIVFQDVTLFNNSIMENIRVGRKDATDAEVLAAAKLANCDEFALKLPQGYDTIIGENGSELSGGERQRISIARAFLKDAPIILLDEASASLDVENETVIQEALSRLIRDKTVIVIAHRMRTVSGADRIVVLSGGTVAEEGAPKDLLAREDSAFRRMAQLQTASAEWSI